MTENIHYGVMFDITRPVLTALTETILGLFSRLTLNDTK